MDLLELKKEQSKLSYKIQLRDSFNKINTLGGAVCVNVKDKILGCVVVCELPSMNVLEKKTFLLTDPLPYKSFFEAYREMPALIEAFNQLDNEPDILLVKGTGIIHPRRIGLATHLGLILNHPTIGVVDKLPFGQLENGKVLIRGDIVGFEIKTRDHSNPLFVSPGNFVNLGTVLNIIPQTIKHPHKMPEPLHLASKIAKKKVQEILAEN